jgi:hypothetical protein
MNTLQKRKGAFWGEGKGGLKRNLKNHAIIERTTFSFTIGPNNQVVPLPFE